MRYNFALHFTSYLSISFSKILPQSKTIKCAKKLSVFGKNYSQTCSEKFYKAHCKPYVVELRFWIVYSQAKFALSNKLLLQVRSASLYLSVPSIARYTSSFFNWFKQIALTNDFFPSVSHVYYFLLNISSQLFAWCKFISLVIEIS